ncbi:hypothetical protein H0B56_00305 [Haloechinothrix sp. YIM 98757]|uniref:Uncharacterized protein n=1 Tax=Haloechinothrix aidingensis TaxID=2752311 RepID=A0A838A6V0_9PSEU|nr:hypothetical protein [Haloechinothrix aidingensis]MBA0123981.1 hypothetical protein [Haloechinothrix aidingensis]
MRFPACLEGQPARRTTTALGLAGFLTGATLLGTTGTAAAAVSAEGCSAEISGSVGESIELSSDAVRDNVVESVRDGLDAPLLGIKSERTRMEEAFDAGKFDPIPLGTVPDKGSSVRSGETIAEAVLDKIDSVPDVEDIAEREKNRERITDSVSNACAIAVAATDHDSGSDGNDGARSGGDSQGGSGRQQDNGSQNGSAQNGQRSESAAGHEQDLRERYEQFQSRSGSDARAPRRDYGDIPEAQAGAAEYGTAPSELYGTDGSAGSAPEFGMLGADEPEGDAAQHPGEAEALAASEQQPTMQLPVLLAVIALAGTGAALFRTWVLRHV